MRYNGKRNLVALQIDDKIKIISEVRRGVRRKKGIAAAFGIPASTLSTILKNQDKYVNSASESPCFLQRKRLKFSSFPELETAMMEWVRRVRDHGLQISGQLIIEKAVKL